MDGVCPGCAQIGTVQWLAEACAYICCACATIVDEAPLDALDADADAPPRPPTRPLGEPRRWPLAYDRAQARVESDRRHHAQIRAMLQGACLRLGWEHAATQARALFERAHASRPERTRTRWGAGATALAAACLYAVLRDEDRIVDVAAVAAATDQPLAAVVHACGVLSRIPMLPRVRVNDPGLYWRRYAAYLEAEPPPPLAHLSQSLRWANVCMHTEQLYRLCTQYEWAGLDAQPFAYAMVMHGIEGTLQRTLPVRALAEAAPPIMTEAQGDEWLVGPPHGSVASVLARYAELHKMLAVHVQRLPWVVARPMSKKERDRTRHQAPGTPRRVSRADVARYMTDAVQMAPASADARGLGWTHLFGRTERPTRVTRGYAPPSSTMAARLGLSAPQIEALSEAEVDACLFEADELASYLRTPDEQARWQRLKGWDVPLVLPPVPIETPPPKRSRIAHDKAHLTQPLDLAQQTDGAADWDK